MKRAVIAVAALLFIGGGYWVWRSNQQPNAPKVDESALTPDSAEAKINQFLEDRGWVLPANVERANLSGTVESDTGVATREPQGNGTLITIMANLADPTEGDYYAWYQNNGVWVRLGTLTPAKGGYLLEQAVAQPKEAIGGVTISRETRPGTAPTTVVLQGSFTN